MKIEIFAGANGQWFVRIKSSNGRVIADAGEGYQSERNARAAADRLKAGLHRAKVVVL